jgi:hypothetical protein
MGLAGERDFPQKRKERKKRRGKPCSMEGDISMDALRMLNHSRGDFLLNPIGSCKNPGEIYIFLNKKQGSILACIKLTNLWGEKIKAAP